MMLHETIRYLHEVVDQVPDAPNKYAVSAKVSWRTILNLRILLAEHEGKPATAEGWRRKKERWLATFSPRTAA